MDPNQQQLLLTSGGAGDEITFVDDVYSTFLYRGNSSLYKLNSIANGVKLGTSNFGNSVHFSENTDQIDYSDSADFHLGNGDFTIECWIRGKQATNTYYTALGQWSSGQFGWMVRYSSQDVGTGWSFFYSTNGSNYITTMGADISDGNWHHIAITRTYGNLRTFTDGVLNTTRSTSDTFHDSTSVFAIGGQSTTGNYFNGLISNLRIVKGTALYTANFTPPTGALTNVTNTVFLGCQSSLNLQATVQPSAPVINAKPEAIAVGPFTASGAGRGGMVMTKTRSAGNNWGVYSTTSGPTKVLSTTGSNAFDTNSATNEMISFDANGFTLGQDQNNAPNTNNQDIVAYTFAKQTGFFDIVTWTGDQVAGREIPHNLGSVPGCIMVKCTSAHGTAWRIYHRGTGNTKALEFSSAVASTNTAFWNDASPTSTHFTVGTSLYINGNGNEFIAYVFAGGESDEPGSAKSVEFDGSGDYLSVPTSTDFDFGNGDFTIECWIKTTQTSDAGIVNISNGSATSNSSWIFYLSNGQIDFYWTTGTGWSGSINGVKTVNNNQWHHVAVTRTGGYFYLYIDGILDVRYNIGTTSIATSTRNLEIGTQDGNFLYNGLISNVRIVKGTAVYTSSFKPSIQGLTDVTNTKLLCCNKNTVTGSTVTPGTITSNGDPQSSPYTPFDDLEGFAFGAGADQNIIKTGSYTGNGNSTGPEVYIGWETQYLLVKNSVGSATQNWRLLDTMRGFDYAGGADQRLFINSVNQESAANIIDLTSTGFKLTTNDASVNGNNEEYIYIAIRRPDGLVGKPVIAASKSFALDYGNSSSTIPSYDSGFPVDYGLEKRYNQTYDWWSSSRITGGTYVRTSSNVVQSGPNTDYCWDSMEGYVGASWANSNTIAFMFRRGKGVDVVPYTGNGVQGRSLQHSLGQTPQMIWIKSRTSVTNWATGHIGLNGGTNPWNYYLQLDTTLDQNGSFAGSDNVIWGDGAPSATHFNIGNNSSVNTNGENYVAMLFADENDINDNPISKVGYYAGSNSANPINLGFSPRFFLLKNINATEYWPVHNTLRGFDQRIAINNANPEGTATGWVTPTASGVTLIGNQLPVNKSGNNYIYYAHA